MHKSLNYTKVLKISKKNTLLHFSQNFQPNFLVSFKGLSTPIQHFNPSGKGRYPEEGR